MRVAIISPPKHQHVDYFILTKNIFFPYQNFPTTLAVMASSVNMMNNCISSVGCKRLVKKKTCINVLRSKTDTSINGPVGFRSWIEISVIDNSQVNLRNIFIMHFWVYVYFTLYRGVSHTQQCIFAGQHGRLQRVFWYGLLPLDMRSWPNGHPENLIVLWRVTGFGFAPRDTRRACSSDKSSGYAWVVP